MCSQRQNKYEQRVDDQMAAAGTWTWCRQTCIRRRHAMWSCFASSNKNWNNDQHTHTHAPTKSAPGEMLKTIRKINPKRSKSLNGFYRWCYCRTTMCTHKMPCCGSCSSKLMQGASNSMLPLSLVCFCGVVSALLFEKSCSIQRTSHSHSDVRRTYTSQQQILQHLIVSLVLILLLFGWYICLSAHLHSTFLCWRTRFENSSFQQFLLIL